MIDEILKCVEEIEGSLTNIILDIDNNDCDSDTEQEISKLEGQLEGIKELLEDYGCDNCSDLGERINGLEGELDTLEKSNPNLDSLVDKMKFDCFMENHNKFNLEEFQQLMQ